MAGTCAEADSSTLQAGQGPVPAVRDGDVATQHSATAGTATSRRPFLTAAWRSLAMINFSVEPELLSEYVPPGTQLDDHDGRVLLSVVGFLFQDARLFGVRLPLYQSFPEMNLRFYVRRTVEGRLRRGVVFIKEVVPRRAVAFVARRVFGENFARLPMWHRARPLGPDETRPLSEYAWCLDGTWGRLRVRGAERGSTPPPESEEAFVVNHFWAYTGRPGKKCREYFVAHRRWRIWPAAEASLEGNLAALYGQRLAAALRGQPSSALVADGSVVAVYPGKPLAA